MSSDYAPAMSEITVKPHVHAGVSRVAIVLIVLGAIGCIAALPGEAGRARFAFGYLWGFSFLWSVVLGCLFFVGLQHVTSSIWSVVVRRIAESFTAPMWLLGLLFIPVLLFVILPNQFPVFPWTDAELMEHDHILHGKQAYLNVPFFIVRAVAFFTIWIGFARYFVRTSLKQDRGAGGVSATLSMRKVAAPFTIIFGVTATFAGIDWLMSINPYWFSTIFGVYVFSGMVLAALAAITIVLVRLRDSGRLPAGLITKDHLYNLGALLFAFTSFWGYIAFSQYMLIWYANVPEETFYLYDRVSSGWIGVSVALALIRFVIPFLLLLSRHAKMNTGILFWTSVLVLGGQLLDLYWLIMPELHREHPILGWREVGPLLLLVGLLVMYVSRFLGRHAPLAVGDPLLAQSRAFRL